MSSDNSNDDASTDSTGEAAATPLTGALGPPESGGFIHVLGTGVGDPPEHPGPIPSPASVELVDGELRFRHVVHVGRKLPYADRVLARVVMPGDTPDEVAASAAARRFVDALGADCPDDDPTWPVGAETFYSLMLTEAEAQRERDADNVVSCTVEARIDPL